MSAPLEPVERLLRFACYRDLSPFSPRYLGEVLATDRAHAEQLGAQEFSGAVVAMRACGASSAVEPNPALERVVARAVKSADNRAHRGAQRHLFARNAKRSTPDGDST